MSINIDKKKLRKELDFRELCKAYPLRFHITGATTVTYDGEYLIITSASATYDCIGTGFGSPSYEATRSTYYLSVMARIKAPGNDTSIYFFFLEPRKGVYADFQGFRHDGTYHCFEFRNGDAEEQDNIADQDWTTEHIFRIVHYKDQSLCQGYIDGALVAECTDNTKISAQPFSVYTIEPNGVARTVYLKYPPGIHEYSYS